MIANTKTQYEISVHVHAEPLVLLTSGKYDTEALALETARALVAGFQGAKAKVFVLLRKEVTTLEVQSQSIN